MEPGIVLVLLHYLLLKLPEMEEIAGICLIKDKNRAPEVLKVIEGKQTGEVVAKLKFGLIGGGSGSFIGDVHRKGAQFDDKSQLVAGCFSRSWDVTQETGTKLGIDPSRLYRSFHDMAVAEGQRSDGIDFVIIASPNNTHFEAAKVFLENGIHVMCDKPLTHQVEESEELVRLAKERNLLLGVTYAYSQGTMVRQAREMVRRGDIGEVRVVMAEYAQGWLAEQAEASNKQAAWRTDPKLAGISNCVGDIGSHIEHIVTYITGLKIKRLCARLDAFGHDRSLDTNAHIMLEYEGGAVGSYWASQVAIGRDNSLIVRIHGTKGTIEWDQETPDLLKVALLGQPVQIYSRGNGYLYDEAAAISRIPAGHPEGYYESFANTYSPFLDAVAKLKLGEVLTPQDLDFPNGEDGLTGVKFIHACVKSSQEGSVWVNL